MNAARDLAADVAEALKRKMVLIGGPRQVGKTTFALGFLGPGADATHPAISTGTIPPSRPGCGAPSCPANEPLLLLDEIHKYARWRNLLKGIYDTENGSSSPVRRGSTTTAKAGIRWPGATATSACIRSRCAS